MGKECQLDFSSFIVIISTNQGDTSMEGQGKQPKPYDHIWK